MHKPQGFMPTTFQILGFLSRGSPQPHIFIHRLVCLNGLKTSPFKYDGYILIMALLYLFAMALLVSSSFSSSLLQSKMSAHAYHQAIAFQNAQNALIAGENSIQGNAMQGEGQLSLDASYSYVQQSQDGCGTILYLVTATGIHIKAKSVLQSLFAVPASKYPACEEAPQRQRLYWNQLS